MRGECGLQARGCSTVEPEQKVSAEPPVYLATQVKNDELKKLIQDVDADGTGQIEFPEFLQIMTGKVGENDSREEIMKIFKLFDKDQSGARRAKTLDENSMAATGPQNARRPSPLQARSPLPIWWLSRESWARIWRSRRFTCWR